MIDNDDIPFAVIPVDKASPVPAYIQVEQDLRRKIVSGILKKDDQLPRETILATRYHTSRVTIRKALNILAEEGLVLRLHGLGTLIGASVNKISCNLNVMKSVVTQLISSGIVPIVQIDRQELINIPEFVANELRTIEAQKVIYLRRIIKVGGVTIAINSSWFVGKKFMGLENIKLIDNSVWKTIREHFGLELINVKNKIDLVHATLDEARLLGVKEKSPTLRLQGILHYDNDGTSAEYTSTLWGENVTLSYSSS